MIKRVARTDIDDKLWNGAVHFALNDFPYGYTWYLDNVAEQWEGLIYGNYEMVMPLVFNTRYNIRYLYQPLYTQQLGVFSEHTIKAGMVKKFLDAIPEEYSFIEINPAESDKFKISVRKNLILHLNKTYSEIEKNYSENLKRNLKKARNANLQIHTHIKPEKLVEFYAENTGSKVKEWKPKHKHLLHRIIYNAMHYNMGQLAAVQNENGQLIAANFFLSSKKRIINLLPASNDEGRNNHAMSHLLNFIIQTHCNKEMVLDFEGSMIEGVARYYKSFGAVDQSYFHIKQNNLPWLAKIFKR
jgi:hypothetical protein